MKTIFLFLVYWQLSNGQVFNMGIETVKFSTYQDCYTYQVNWDKNNFNNPSKFPIDGELVTIDKKVSICTKREVK